MPQLKMSAKARGIDPGVCLDYQLSIYKHPLTDNKMYEYWLSELRNTILDLQVNITTRTATRPRFRRDVPILGTPVPRLRRNLRRDAKYPDFCDFRLV
jgi:hypothetical protein